MRNDDYKSKEEKKSEIFGIITMIIVTVVLVAIIVFAVTNKTDKTEEDETEVLNSETVSIADDNSTATEQENSLLSQENISASTVSDNNSSAMQQELDSENKQYESDEKRINEDYDNKIATQQKMKQLVISNSASNVEDVKVKINELDGKIAALEKSADNESLLRDYKEQRATYQAKVDSYNNDIAKFDNEIKRFENERSSKLNDLRKSHEEKVSLIKAKY